MAIGNLATPAKKTASVIKRSSRIPTATKSNRHKQSFPIFNIELSSGQFDMMQQFFSSLAPDCGGTFIVSISFLTKLNTLSDLLSTSCQMPCFVVVDGMKLQPGCIYLVPFSYQADVSNGIFLLRNASKKQSKMGNHTMAQMENDAKEIRANLEAAFSKIANSADHLRMEDELRSAHDRLISILDVMADGVYITNDNLDIEYANPALKVMFGDPQGRKCYAFFRDFDTTCPDCVIEHVFAENTIQREWNTFDKTFSIIYAPLKNPDGRLSKLGIIRDLTEQRQAQSERRH